MNFLYSMLLFFGHFCFCNGHIYNVEVRSYCPGECCCGKYADGKTSTLRFAYLPGIAIPQPGPISYNEFVTIRGYGRFKADDRSGDASNKWRHERKLQIEVRFSSHDEALEWGVKKKFIFVEHKYDSR